MENEFVPYELAVKLKELGFDEPCSAVYFGNGENELFTFNPSIAKESTIRMVELGHIPCPTFSQAFRWFREKYKIFSCIMTEYSFGGHISAYHINGVRQSNISVGDFETYEEAELACLEMLIELTFKSE